MNMERFGAYLWVCLVFLAIAVTLSAILYFAAHPLR
jgi:hypothetical protein